jgi:small subunit ribosomal protein S5
MAELLDETSAIESTTVGVYRTAATIKGGRRFSFSALVVVGDRSGRVGMGYGKANQVPPAIEKAQKDAKRRMKLYPRVGRTLPHEVTGRFGSCSVRMIPASPGTGVIAGAAVRAPLEMMGIQDCLTKSFGSNNSKNLVKAVIDGLSQLRSKDQIQALRGVDVGTTLVEDAVRRGQAFMPAQPETAEPAEPVEAPPPPSRGPGKKGGGRGGRGRGEPRGGGTGGAGVKGSPKTDAPKAAPPKAETPKAEAPKDEAPKDEVPKDEVPKAEVPKTETPAPAKDETPPAEPAPESTSPPAESQG